MKFEDLNDESILYLGNITNTKQEQHKNFFGVSPYNWGSEKDIVHDIKEKFPLGDCSICGIQSEDVFEHLTIEELIPILDEMYRILKVGSFMRVSLPDYNSPLLMKRSIYNYKGEIICDSLVGSYMVLDGEVIPKKGTDGNDHMWFPILDTVYDIIRRSKFNDSKIKLHHGFYDRDKYICDDFDASIYSVKRCPPNDMRNNGKPVSIILDLFKENIK